MANTPTIPLGNDPEEQNESERACEKPRSAARPLTDRWRVWQKGAFLSSATRASADWAEQFLAKAGFDRAPWLVVFFGSGILAWFALKHPLQWTYAVCFGFCVAFGAIAAFPRSSEAAISHGHLRAACIACGLMFAAGVAVIWARSEMIGAEPIAQPTVEHVQGYVLSRNDQPAHDRVRLTLAVRDVIESKGRKIRINVPIKKARPEMAEGAIINARVRLMPPAPPMLPGSYDFARAAWFKGLAATGSLIGEATVVKNPPPIGGIASLQRDLSSHVRSRLDGSAGSIAAAFASGDRGAISEQDADAMRDAGLTHLLAISGLHVSAVIAAAYLIALKLLAFIPAIALRVRIPILAAAVGAFAGIGYTLLTGGQVPTVRACVAAMLVLGALALGRDALSLRMVAVAAMVVLLLWPESIVGPSFQMSFAAVLAIVAFHSSGPVRAFLAAREEAWFKRSARQVLMLFLTGLVIEIALMPIVMFHFHRAGVYGAFANVVAIPLVTFVAMPLIALALLLDGIGAGAPVWWLVGKSLDLLLWIARFTSSQPGAVKLMPQMSGWIFALFAIGGLWLALWKRQGRLLGLLPVCAAGFALLQTPVPDILIGREGRHVGIVLEDGRLLSLKDTRSTYVQDNLLELGGVTGDLIPIAQWPDADCSDQFCTLNLSRNGRDWTLLLARNREMVEERALAAACERADIVVADRYLPRSCKPMWLRADKRHLDKSGGLALDLSGPEITKVADTQGAHGWWQGEGGARQE